MTFFWRFVPSRDLLRLPMLRWLVITRFFGDLFFYSTTLVLFQQQRGLNYTQIFLMEAILSVAIWTADIPTSIWSERFGYARMLLVGRAVGLLGMVVFTLAYGFWLFALAEVIGGIAIAAISGCESALLYNALPLEQKSKRGGEAFALLSSASSAGFFLGLFTGSFLGAYSPLLAVVVSLVPALFAFLAAFRLLHYAPTLIVGEGSEQARMNKIVYIAWHTLRAQPALVVLRVFRSAAFALTNAIFWYNQPYFMRVGIPVVFWGPLMADAIGVQFLLLLHVSILQRLLGTRFLLLLSCLLPGICYLLLPLSATAMLTVFLVGGIAVFSALLQPLVEQELNVRIANQARATTLSALAFFGSPAKILLDPFIGYLGDRGLDSVGVGLGVSLIGLGILVLLLITKLHSIDHQSVVGA